MIETRNDIQFEQIIELVIEELFFQSSIPKYQIKVGQPIVAKCGIVKFFHREAQKSVFLLSTLVSKSLRLPIPNFQYLILNKEIISLHCIVIV